MDFVKELVILDTETTGTNLLEADVVEVATLTLDEKTLNPIFKRSLFGSSHAIPPEASMVNNISNRMITGKPLLMNSLVELSNILHLETRKYFLAHNALFDHKAILEAFKRGQKLDLKSPIMNIDGHWICTLRLSQLLYPDLPMHKLSYLRYALDLNVSEDVGAHRADADVLTALALLDHLTKYAIDIGRIKPTDNIIEKLIELSWAPVIVTKWPKWGKHQGQEIKNIDTGYLIWAIKNSESFNEDNAKYDAPLAEAVIKELENRGELK